jgi:hypothetical protein
MIKHKLATGVIKWYLVTFKYVAITMPWFTIYYLNKEGISNIRLRKHEMAHIEQMKRDGRFMFLVKYFYYLARYGYRQNPYEVEARAKEF